MTVPSERDIARLRAGIGYVSGSAQDRLDQLDRPKHHRPPARRPWWRRLLNRRETP